MDLLALVDFNLVARHGGFGRAARATGRPKATLSRRVAELESSLDLRLFERGTRALKLTQEGRALHERTEALLTELDETAAAIRAVLCMSSLVMVRDAVRLGVGAGCLPISLVSHDLAAGKLVHWGDVDGPDIALWTLYPSAAAAASPAPPAPPPSSCAERMITMRDGRVISDVAQRPIAAAAA